jgi:hypothetical protein
MKIDAHVMDVVNRAFHTGQDYTEEPEWDEESICESGVDTTRDDFGLYLSGSQWRERGGKEVFEIDGHRCVYWDRVQARKGDQRVAVTVVDFGDFRAVYQR